MAVQHKGFSRACELHDQTNLLLLPVLAGLAFAGLAGLVDTYIVTCTLTAYIVADLVWLLLQPECVPSLSGVIVAHHIVTLGLLSFPLRYPHLGLFACLDGSVEINTFFLIARRQVSCPMWARVHSALYWITLIPMRLVMYPYLLLPFYHTLGGHSWAEKVLCLGCQVLLCAFNYGLLHTHIRAARRRKQRALAAAKAAAEDGSACTTADIGIAAKLESTEESSAATVALGHGTAAPAERFLDHDGQCMGDGETAGSSDQACARPAANFDHGSILQAGGGGHHALSGPPPEAPLSPSAAAAAAGSAIRRRCADAMGPRCAPGQFQADPRTRVALRPRIA